MPQRVALMASNCYQINLKVAGKIIPLLNVPRNIGSQQTQVRAPPSAIPIQITSVVTSKAYHMGKVIFKAHLDLLFFVFLPTIFHIRRKYLRK
ncbi:hypothetical protein LTR27_010731 [Elasticomyces elasticus]|nr:hypothetical protein LTR27_010731 [Elasticomyces elasticus]